MKWLFHLLCKTHSAYLLWLGNDSPVDLPLFKQALIDLCNKCFQVKMQTFQAQLSGKLAVSGSQPGVGKMCYACLICYNVASAVFYHLHFSLES